MIGGRKTAALTALAILAGSIPEPTRAQTFDPAAIQRVADGCTADEAFGHAFGEVTRNAPRQVAPPAGWAPFDRFDVYRAEHSEWMWKVEAIAFAGFGVEADRETLLALTGAVDTVVEQGGRFGSRAEDGYTVTYSDLLGDDGQPSGSAVSLEINPLLGMVWVTCSDADLAAEAEGEFFGRARLAERPVPPTTPPAARPNEDLCVDPASRRATVNRFAGLGGIGGMGSASERYFSQLASWYGQKMVAAGVWDDDDKLGFALGVLDDPVISQELEAQMTRLAPYMEASADFRAAEDARDEGAACRAAVRMMQVAHDMTLSNERQWLRAEALYEAEGARLGVELK